jgi:hypothetical protein
LVDGHKAIELALTGLSSRMTGLDATAGHLWVDAASRSATRIFPLPDVHAYAGTNGLSRVRGTIAAMSTARHDDRPWT